ncbi:MAG TPA: septal ring lytic transglycosylase RlpA family protein [Balneolales bacterium]|nr:septal ring lytic transglycosylase RlpA family protein [Balneolales bacterium]
MEYGRVIDYGVASWYGPQFHGKLTANGERYNQNALTAANRTLPFNTHIKVIDLDNGRSVVVRINDRGPYAKGRIIDLSKAAAKRLHMIGPGTAHVKLVLVRGNVKTIQKNNSYNAGNELFAIQIGAFSNKWDAKRQLRKIKHTWIEKVKLRGKTMYRVYYGKYKHKADAEKARKYLFKRGIGGFVKEVQN